jgi:hypothetical protein
LTWLLFHMGSTAPIGLICLAPAGSAVSSP